MENNILEYLADFNNEPETLIELDRDRDVLYNCIEITMNNYECSSCKNEYFFEIQVPHLFCPNCGVKYKFKTNISM
jgi:DNA-directed RNA polymerase subunit RPC12/RpoP